MAIKVGAVEFDVDADGTGFENQVRRIGGQAGTKGGHAFSKQWADAVRKDQGVFESAFRGISARFGQIINSGKGIKGLSDAWGGLSHNTKQWTLIIGAALAGMQSLAVLGSAAAGGLLILGGAAGGAIVGIGALVTAFAGLGGDLEKLPESVRPAAQAFQDLKGPLQAVQDLLQERAFAGADKVFQSIGRSIERLTPAFGPLGDAINRIITGFSTWLESDEGIRQMTGLIEGSAPIFEKIVGLVGKLGKAFLNAFNNPQFQKAIDDMLTGLGGLFDTFEAFTASDDFGVWIQNTSAILGELGELLGATSDMFADLVTPEAYARTKEFLDNLTDFMPHLGNLLDILGRLDVFGILAQLLADLGEALEPLAKPFGDLAEAISKVVSIAIDEWGKDLKPIAEALAPFVQGLADLIADVDPAVIRAIASALLALAGGLVILQAVKFVGLVTGLGGFFTAVGKGGPILKNFPFAKLGQLTRGLGAIGALAATELIPDSFWEQFNIESNLPDSILTGAAFGSMFGWWGVLIGAGIGVVVSLFTDFENTMNDIGFGMLDLFAGGGAFGLLGSSIATFFANLVPEEWRSSDNPLEQNLAALADVITNTGSVIVFLAEQIGTWFQDLSNNVTTVVSAIIAKWTELWTALNNPAFWDSIGTNINNWLALVGAYFAGKMAEIGATWSTAWAGLGIVVSGYSTYIQNLVTALVVGVKATIASGLAGAAAGWNNFWGNLPNAVAGAANRIAGIVGGIISSVQRALSGIGNLSRQAGSLGGGGGGGNTQGFASGGVLNGPRRILAGEDGPEAIVPLRRHLSRVDPSVRWLSALAQGRTPAMASGGIAGGGGRNVTVEAGAIVVEEASSALATGVEVLDRLAARLA